MNLFYQKTTFLKVAEVFLNLIVGAAELRPPCWLVPPGLAKAEVVHHPERRLTDGLVLIPLWIFHQHRDPVWHCSSCAEEVV